MDTEYNVLGRFFVLVGTTSFPIFEGFNLLPFGLALVTAGPQPPEKKRESQNPVFKLIIYSNFAAARLQCGRIILKEIKFLFT